MGKVLHVNDFAVGKGGGAEVIMGRTLDLLSAAGWEIDSFTADDLTDKRPTVRRYLDNPISRRQFRDRLTRWRPDIVHLHNFYHVLSPGILDELVRYKRHFSARVVMSAHDYHLICPNSGGTWFTLRAQRRLPVDAGRVRHWSYLLGRKWDHRGPVYSLLKLLQHVWHYRLRDRRPVIDAILAPSRFVQALFRQAGLKSIFLPHPAPTVQPVPAKSQGPLRLAFVGRVEREKGLWDFLNLLPPRFEGTLTVIGQGGDLDRCRQVCQQTGLADKVIFLGRKPHNEIAGLLGRAHLLVLPSLFLESYGLCLVEALAVGTNILVSDRGAGKELVEDSGIGFVFRHGDADSLHRKLARIMEQHRGGILNAFDATEFLRQRGESAYLQGLLHVYQAQTNSFARVAA